MDTIVSFDSPKKQCRTCGQSKFATKDFFSAVPAYTSPDCLHSQCRVCRNIARKQAKKSEKREPQALGDGTFEIPLTKGKIALIDAYDLDLCDRCQWSYGDRTTPNSKKKRYTEESGCAKRRFLVDGKPKTVRLHWLIMERKLGHPIPEGYVVDHINGNPLDNRRENLRLATLAQNAWNADKERNHTNPYKGVSYDNGKHPRRKRWVAKIRANNRNLTLGRFHTPEEAALAYNNAALRYYGEYARLNELAS